MLKLWICSLSGAGALLLAAAQLQAQSEQEPVEETPPAVEQEQPAPARTGEPNEDSPYDYRASEEISEDLSVSFPVDI